MPIVLYLALITALGYMVQALLVRLPRRPWPLALGWCFAAGAGTLGMLLFWASLLGYPPSRAVLALIAAAVVGVWGWERWRSGKSEIRMTEVGECGGGSDMGHSDLPRISDFGFRVFSITAWLVIAAAAINVVLVSYAPAIADIDSFAIWVFKAKIVFTEPLRPVPAALLNPGLSYSHQDYPLNLPMLVAGVFATLGRVDDLASKRLLFPLICRWWRSFTAACGEFCDRR